MKLIAIAKPIVLFIVTVSSTVLFILLSRPSNQSSPRPASMAARSFVLWLHGLGDSGPANEPIKSLFTSPEFRNTKWSFPTAPSTPVSCNCEFTFSLGQFWHASLLHALDLFVYGYFDLGSALIFMGF
ncbi:hypothetical protein C1H46_015670 [Malus baccata]|uniref:Phospholipase/carboxylesterase/thioesterase domain-containing protein n=1 Tax=Malus baccata TaxID=106549 RepID=A0A540MJ08_MALBA|nr:hypothetical protein C1H46_015670 [Malus baccata]